MNLGAVLLTGLLAGGLSCAAVQGGLLTGMLARQRGTAPSPAARHTQRLADDLVPVSGFLTGKLISHTLLGLLLGSLGTVVQLSPHTRAMAQLAAGALIIVFGLGQLGVPGLRAIRLEPPAQLTRFVRSRARMQSAAAPALLGFSTVLIPCGVTLSVQALALTSGSAGRGAAIMAVFVVGTIPLFAALGYVARRAAAAWHGRLAALTGLTLLAVGTYTLNGGLTMVDSPLAAPNLAKAIGLSAEPASAETVSIANGTQTAVITARTGSYRPGNVQVRAGIRTILQVRSDRVDGCTRTLVVNNRQYVLPENGETRVDLGVLQPGELRYHCGMGMYSGRLTIGPAA